MMKLPSKRKGGFTLIELMIVVAIIGILAAIAIPNFLRFQLRSRSGEGRINIAAIRTAQEAYAAEFNTYLAATTAPAVVPVGDQKVQFSDPGSASSNFDTIGWRPEGAVYFNYAVASGCPTAGGGFQCYFVAAVADIDADMVVQEWGYHAPQFSFDANGNITSTNSAAAPGVTGTCNPGTVAMGDFNVTGSCQANFGQSVF